MTYRVLGAVALGALLGCADEPYFLPLESLCIAVASDRCNARASCCATSDITACKLTEEDLCIGTLKRLGRETSRRYDAAKAVVTRADDRSTLEKCDELPSLMTYFSGGLAGGEDCTRDAQCESDACDSERDTCVEVEAEPLCSAS